MIHFFVTHDVVARLRALVRGPRPRPLGGVDPDAENARVAEWALRRGFEMRDECTYVGVAGRLEVLVDSGCRGSSPRGVRIILRHRGLVTEPTLLTEKRRNDAVALDALFDDLTLAGSLRAIAITAEEVTLELAPRRATEVYDVALRLSETLLAETAELDPPRAEGPYR